MEVRGTVRIRREILRWLSPTEDEPTYFQDRFQELIESKCEGTCEWLLEEDKYQAWILPQSLETVLWLNGDPGTGKSMLAASVVDQVSRDPKLQHQAVIYFFVDGRSNDPNRTQATAILRSFVYQLSCSPNIPDNGIIEKAFQASGQERALQFDVLWNIFSALLSLSAGTIITLDGLDESNDSKIEKLISNLLNLISGLDGKIKLFIFSRSTSEPHICELLHMFPSITVTARKTSKDMEIFVSINTKKVLKPCSFSTAELIETVSSSLIAGANGMYFEFLQ